MRELPKMFRALSSASAARALPVALAACTMLASAVASAATPAISAVEGVLYSSGGGAAADGNYNVTFSLYKDEVGGNPIWFEGPVVIGVKSGQWQHLLGSTKALTTAALNGGTLFLGLQIASDAELPRKPLAAAAFAVRAAVADGIECSGCVGAGHIDSKFLAGYAKTADLNKVALSGAFSDLTGGPDLSAYVKGSALSKVATGGNYTDLNGIPDLTLYAKVTDLGNYVKAASLATVAGTGSFNDLKDKPVLSKKGDKCGSGLVMIGIKADGSYECTASAIAPDMIDEISNGLIYNQFIDTQAGTLDNAIPDGAGAGKNDSLDFPDIGQAQAIWVNVNLSNSDVSKVKIELYGPGMGTPYVLYNGEKAGSGFSVSFNKDTPLSTGDMNKDWVGKNIKGTWSITVKDPFKNQSTANDGKFNWDITIQTLSSKKIQIKGNVIIDGALNTNAGAINLGDAGMVTGLKAPKMATYRYAFFNTYVEAAEGWMRGDNPFYFGGVAPSTWTDGNATAQNIKGDKENLRTLFVNKGYANGYNALLWSEVYLMYSSTNGRVYLSLWRIRNNTQSDITWPIWMTYSAYTGWGENASVAVNGTNQWNSPCNSQSVCDVNFNLTIPKNRISTVIFQSTGAQPYSWGYNLQLRKIFQGFYNNSLKMPAGLEIIDDLDTVQGTDYSN